MSPSLSTEPQKMKYYSACLLLYPHHQVLWLFNRCHVILCDPMDCSTPGFPVLHHFLESAQTHVHWVRDAIQPSYPLSPPFLLPSIFPSIRVFSNESALRIRWPKYWNFQFSISPFSEYSGLISFRIDCFDLLAVKESPTPRFESISSLALKLLYGPALSHTHTCCVEQITEELSGWQSDSVNLQLPQQVIYPFCASVSLLVKWE